MVYCTGPEYRPPDRKYRKPGRDFTSYIPFIPFTRKKRWQLGNGVLGRLFPFYSQMDILEDVQWETEEIYTHEAKHRMNPAASERDIRDSTRNLLGTTRWH
jgi:hypothetical protein